jgi:hypothetical protein
VKGTKTFILWGAMNLEKVMQNFCEMGRDLSSHRWVVKLMGNPQGFPQCSCMVELDMQALR